VVVGFGGGGGKRFVATGGSGVVLGGVQMGEEKTFALAEGGEQGLGRERADGMR